MRDIRGAWAARMDITNRDNIAVGDCMSGGSVDRREVLDLLQSRLLDELRSETGRDVAVISKELRAVTAELESLPTGRKSTVDDLAARRAARLSEATG